MATETLKNGGLNDRDLKKHGFIPADTLLRMTKAEFLWCRSWLRENGYVYANKTIDVLKAADAECERWKHRSGVWYEFLYTHLPTGQTLVLFRRQRP